MNEDYLQYLFDCGKLGNEFVTTEGEPLFVQDKGELNRSSGPDFEHGKIQFDNKTWAGHIEFHMKSSDWFKHKHHTDTAYNNVIAHFVWEHDKEVYIDQFKLPVVELMGKVNMSDYDRYRSALLFRRSIPCESHIKNLDATLIRKQIGICASDRLQRKGQEVFDLIRSLNGDQYKAKLILIGKALGGKVNQKGFEELARKIDRSTLSHLNYDPFKVESLLLGLAGLLPERSSEAYVQKLKEEFDYQKSFFQLQVMPKTAWKLFGMRPASHPVFRIAQFAAICCRLDSEDSYTIELHDFWKKHHHFDKETYHSHSTALSKKMKQRLAINVKAPMLSAKAFLKDDHTFYRQAVDLLESTAAEEYTVIKFWRDHGVALRNAMQTQGVLELHNQMCKQKKCLFCNVGRTILNK